MRPTPPARVRAASAACESLEARRLFAVELVSVAAAGGATGNAASPPDGEFIGAAAPSSDVSDNGRYVVFLSEATDLVPGAFAQPAPVGFEARNAYVRDRAAGTTTLVSVRPDGHAAGSALAATISGDGRYVAFTSSAGGIVAGDDARTDVYVRDLVAGTTALASHTAAGAPANDESYGPTISRSGRYVTYFSQAADIANAPPGAGVNFPALYRYDVQTGAVAAVADLQMVNGLGLAQQVSDDGNVVAYVASRPGADPQVYVKDMTTGVETLASATAAGQPVEFAGRPSIALSGDGRHLAFTSVTRAAANDANDITDVFVRDLAAGTTVLASTASSGNSVPSPAAEGSDLAVGRAISNDGRFVLIETNDDLTGVPDRNGVVYSDVYVRDLQANTTRLLSVDPAGDDGEEAFFASLSDDGRYAAFVSVRPAVLSGGEQVIVVDLSTGAQTLASPKAGGGHYVLGQGFTTGNSFSRSGNVLLFAGETDASTAVPGLADANGTFDLFAFPLAAPGGDANPPSAAPTGGFAGVSAPTAAYDFAITWTDDVAIDASTIGNGDVVVTGPNGYRQAATLVTVSAGAAANQANAVYRVAGPGGLFDSAANGNYAIEVAPGEVKDAAGNFAVAAPVAGGTFPVAIPAGDGPDLQAVTLQGDVPASVVAGARQKVKPLKLTVTNAGNQPATGTVTLRLLASADAFPDAGDATVAEAPARLKLAPGKSKVFKLKASKFPAVADGDYVLLAVVDAGGVLPERVESNNAAPLATPVRIAAPFSDLAVASPAVKGKPAPGKKATVTFTLSNGGNAAARGVQPVRVLLTTDPADPDGASAVTRAFDVPVKVNLKPGKSKSMRAKLALPADLPAGAYSVIVQLLPGAPWVDPVTTNNSATGDATYNV